MFSVNVNRYKDDFCQRVSLQGCFLSTCIVTRMFSVNVYRYKDVVCQRVSLQGCLLSTCFLERIIILSVRSLKSHVMRVSKCSGHIHFSNTTVELCGLNHRTNYTDRAALELSAKLVSTPADREV
jgi:hypothetical protein